MLRAEKFARTLARKLLGGVHGTATRVPTLPGIALCVFVHQHRSSRFAARTAGRVFGSDQVDLRIFLLRLRHYRGKHIWIIPHKAGHVAQTARALELCAPSRMALAFVNGRLDECLGDFDRIFGRNHIGAQAKQIGAVVLPGRGRGIGCRAQRCADILETIRAHAHSDAAAADENSKINRA